MTKFLTYKSCFLNVQLVYLCLNMLNNVYQNSLVKINAELSIKNYIVLDRDEQKYRNTGTANNDRIQAVRYSVSHFLKIWYLVTLVPVLFGKYGTVPIGTDRYILIQYSVPTKWL